MKLLFLGDFFFDYITFPEDLAAVAEFVKDNDYAVVLNLEGAFGKDGNPIKKRGANLAHSPIIYEALEKLNVLAVCLANNHMMDFGGEVLEAGLNELDKRGILHVGAGNNSASAKEPLMLRIDGKTIYIQNFGWDVEETVYATDKKAGCAALISEKIVSQTKEIRKNSPEATIINCFHWGFEFNTLPMPIDVQLAHDCIDAGCNLVIGHHPHVMQPKETWNGREIFYSLGNFYFSSRRNNFSKVFPADPVQNMCDYGLAVEYDLNSQQTKCFNIFYDRENEKTKILQEAILLNDITGVDYRNDEYISRVKKHSSNCNPILGLDQRENRKKIKRLYRQYWVAGKIRFIRKSRVGEKLYLMLKKKVNR